MTAARPRSPLLLGAALLLPAGLLLLAGCGPTPTPPGPAPTTAPPTGSAAPTPSGPSAGPTPPADEGRPVGLSCDQLVTPQAAYDFNPNFALLDPWSPEAGSLGLRATAADGVACRWVSGSGGAVLDVSAAFPGAAGLARIRSLVEDGEPAPYGEESFYGTDAAGRGQLVVFAGGAWLSVVSDYLGDAGDADPVVDAALDALGVD